MVQTFQYVLKARSGNLVDHQVYWTFVELSDDNFTILRIRDNKQHDSKQSIHKQGLIPLWIQKGDRIATTTGYYEVFKISNTEMGIIVVTLRLLTSTDLIGLTMNELKNTFRHFITD